MKGFHVFSVLLILLIGTPAFADLKDGAKSYLSGDYATAMKELKPHAERGDVDAQYILGEMYLEGQGVTQDDRRHSSGSR